MCQMGECLHLSNMTQAGPPLKTVKGQVVMGEFGRAPSPSTSTIATTTTTIATTITTQQPIATSVIVDALIQARIGTEKKKPGDWTEWSHCSNTCGNGIKVRTKEDCKKSQVSGIIMTTCDGEIRDMDLCVGQSFECSQSILEDLKLERNETSNIQQSSNRFVTHAIFAFTALILTAAACVCLFSILLIKIKHFKRNRYL